MCINNIDFYDQFYYNVTQHQINHINHFTIPFSILKSIKLIKNIFIYSRCENIIMYLINSIYFFCTFYSQNRIKLNTNCTLIQLKHIFLV